MKRDTFLTSWGNLHVFCDSKSPYGHHLGPNTQAASSESFWLLKCIFSSDRKRKSQNSPYIQFLTLPYEKFVWSRIMYFGSLVHFFPSAVSLTHIYIPGGLGGEPAGQLPRATTYKRRKKSPE